MLLVKLGAHSTTCTPVLANATFETSFQLIAPTPSPVQSNTLEEPVVGCLRTSNQHSMDTASPTGRKIALQPCKPTITPDMILPIRGPRTWSHALVHRHSTQDSQRPVAREPGTHFQPTVGKHHSQDPMGLSHTLQCTCPNLSTSFPIQGWIPAIGKPQLCSLWIWPTYQETRSCPGTGWAPALPTSKYLQSQAQLHTLVGRYQVQETVAPQPADIAHPLACQDHFLGPAGLWPQSLAVLREGLRHPGPAVSYVRK